MEVGVLATAAGAAIALVSRRRKRRFRVHSDAFQLPDESFRRFFRLSKSTVLWLCDQLRDEEGVRRTMTGSHTMSVEQQVLCALRFFATGSYQGMVATDEHRQAAQQTVSRAVRAGAVAIVRRLAYKEQWIRFLGTTAEKAKVKEEFHRLGDLEGVIGCVDGTFVAIEGPRETEHVCKATYWCRKGYYSLNVMVVSVYVLAQLITRVFFSGFRILALSRAIKAVRQTT